MPSSGTWRSSAVLGSGSGTLLAPWDLPTTPAISSPSGYLDPTAIGTVRKNSTILVTDRMFEEAPPVARVGGRHLVVDPNRT